MPVFEMDESERDLAMRLELARQNSQHQSEHQYTAFPTMEDSNDPIYDGNVHLFFFSQLR